MSSELELLRQRISELEAENAEIPDLRRKISYFDAERSELKRRIAEALRTTEEERIRRDAENTELKSRVGELEARLAIVEQGSSIVDRHDKEVITEVQLSIDNSISAPNNAN